MYNWYTCSRCLFLHCPSELSLSRLTAIGSKPFQLSEWFSSLLSYVDVAVRHTAWQDWTRNCQSQNKLVSTDLTSRATCRQALSCPCVSLYVRKTEQYKISCWRTHSISFSTDTAIIIWTLNCDSPRIHVECGDTGCSVNIHDITWLHNESSSAQLRA